MFQAYYNGKYTHEHRGPICETADEVQEWIDEQPTGIAIHMGIDEISR